jgi:hemerythrin-like domain-containing protein
MRTIDTLRAEHDGVLAVLEQLERAVAAAEAGTAMPADVFGDMEEFFRVFVDRCHHGKEETAVFPALGGAGTPLVDQLEQEHGRGRLLARAYAAAVEEYRPTDPRTVHGLAVAARAYAAFLRAHIALETTELFPRLERTLTADQDAALERAFEEIEEQRIGPGTHERLHQMIGTLGPRITAAGGT